MKYGFYATYNYRKVLRHGINFDCVKFLFLPKIPSLNFIHFATHVKLPLKSQFRCFFFQEGSYPTSVLGWVPLHSPVAVP